MSATTTKTASVTYMEGRAATSSPEFVARKYVEYWNTGDDLSLTGLILAFDIKVQQTDADDTQAHHELITWTPVTTEG